MSIKKKIFNTPAFYLGIGFLVVFIGFLPTYFGKLKDVDFIHHFHGIAATLWMVLLIVQASLFQTRKMKYHHVLGWSSLLLFILVVASILLMFQLRLEKPGNRSNIILWKNSWALLGFIYFYISAIMNRKTFALHTANIFCTLLIILEPAISRYLIFYKWPHGFIAKNMVAYIPVIIVLFILLYRNWKKGKQKVPYLVCLSVILFQEFTLEVGLSEWWKSIINSIS